MHKRLAGQEGKGNLGKPVAKKEGNMGKRVARQKGRRVAGGWMVASRMVTRSMEKLRREEKGSQDPLSSSESDQSLHRMFLEWAEKLNKKYKSEKEREKRFLIWCSTKKRMDELHSHKPGYTSELNVFADMTVSERAKMHGSTFSKDPYDGRRPTFVDLCKTKKDIEELKKARIEFDKWVAQHGRNYDSKKEREKRFLAFLDNKRRIDLSNKAVPGFWTHGYTLGNMDKMFWED